MWKLIRGILVLLLAALLILLVLSYFEKNNGLDFPAAEILEDIKEEGQKILDSVNGFLDKTGIKQSAADLLDEGADKLRATPAPSITPEGLPSPTASDARQA